MSNERFEQLYNDILALTDADDVDLVMGITACAGAVEANICTLLTLCGEDGAAEAKRLANRIALRMAPYALGINPIEEEINNG